MSVLSQVPGGKSMHRDSYGRFAGTAASGDNTSLGWNDFQPMADFADPALGFLVVCAISPLCAAGWRVMWTALSAMSRVVGMLFWAFWRPCSLTEQHRMFHLIDVRHMFSVCPASQRGVGP